jgi:hypothetical protein
MKGLVPILIRTNGLKYHYNSQSGQLCKLSSEKGQEVKEKFQDLPAYIKQEEEEVQLNGLRSPSPGKPGDTDVPAVRMKLADGEDSADGVDEASEQKMKPQVAKKRAAKTLGKNCVNGPHPCPSACNLNGGHCRQASQGLWSNRGAR